MTEEKKEKRELNEGWVDRLLDKCEEAGVSKTVIERFVQYYVQQGGENGAKSDSATKGT
ncbi:hypothetical protein QNH32_01370 [Priestia flexa]|uniref:hypothetical protein n=1 Tax=Priestia flexa TaxID=86664 RepID=UPI0024BFA922|nr:hypothetical protein [Priestia flexa]WHX79330.1 hypothetical protein QNH32_01370 [Priestia flexa]